MLWAIILLIKQLIYLSHKRQIMTYVMTYHVSDNNIKALLYKINVNKFPTITN